MSAKLHPLLNDPPLSLNTHKLAHLLGSTPNVLIVQDLDGVCMELVKDPLDRQIDPTYVVATQQFDRHFYVLTNGEHVGTRGMNVIVERAFGDRDRVRSEGLYLPGLAAGGVQWQDRFGNLDCPGVSSAELSFLAAVPGRIQRCLRQFIEQHPEALPSQEADRCIQSSLLDNMASPTANLNTFHAALGDRTDLYIELQRRVLDLMQTLLAEAATGGLNDSFFLHLAPNLGRDEIGNERIRWASDTDSGTTDFQLMLRGAVKEAGVLALLNRYYRQRTGEFPLGENFSARQAPKEHSALLELVLENFDPAAMPAIVGVGDTVNSSVVQAQERLEVRRGGSDRNFLQLVQDIGRTFNVGNVVAYIDSSGGEVKNRKPVRVDRNNPEKPVAIEGPGDPLDEAEPLTLDLVFAGGHREYISVFRAAAQQRAENF
ncbi:glucosylglycerol 3-phosphatase [Synechococcus sp. PCC 7336]|uniref:glucosylglycerol 3-phosphatase n=1 Tax=Synechococcus sp. PCC 7336 TaxID=195250 RepID=UPI000344E922|nr:glucosylglycerol 3-phosphatase [Synechococcus sp. PCC 7336]